MMQHYFELELASSLENGEWVSVENLQKETQKLRDSARGATSTLHKSL